MNLRHIIPGKVRDNVAWVISRHRLRRAMASSNPGDIVRMTSCFRGVGVYWPIFTMQKEQEIIACAEIVRNLKPRIIVEIGTAHGGTLFIWTRTNPQLELVVSIDLPGGTFGGGYPEGRARLYREFTYGHPKTQMRLLRCDSHSDSTLSLLLQQLAGRKIDFLWIDGDHTYDGVKKDFSMYSALVRKGGIVGFHDIITKGGGLENHEVWRFWGELKQQFPSREIIEDRSSNLMGIGILTV